MKLKSDEFTKFSVPFTSPISIHYTFRGNIEKNASKDSLLKLHSKGYRGQRAGALRRDGLLLQQGAGQDHQWQRSRGQVASSAEYTGGEDTHCLLHGLCDRGRL